MAVKNVGAKNVSLITVELKKNDNRNVYWLINNYPVL